WHLRSAAGRRDWRGRAAPSPFPCPPLDSRGSAPRPRSCESSSCRCRLRQFVSASRALWAIIAKCWRIRAQQAGFAIRVNEERGFSEMRKFCFAAVLTAMFAAAAAAQVTPAPASTPPDDTPKYNIGATLFADYTYNQSPETKDADGNLVHNSSFNVTRAYINVTGNLNHWIAFRITPDVARETGSGTSLNGSQEFRLKFAYAQFNLDDWWTKGSWVRFGVQQTPYIDFNETAYRYRFQGSVFPERVGLLSGGDAGVTVHYNLPNNYGDIHGGFYNGENYFKSEVNNEKGLEI